MEHILTDCEECKNNIYINKSLSEINILHIMLLYDDNINNLHNKISFILKENLNDKLINIFNLLKDELLIIKYKNKLHLVNDIIDEEQINFIEKIIYNIKIIYICFVLIIYFICC